MCACATSARSAPRAEAIDWRRPWLAPYRELGERVAARIAAGASVAQTLSAEASSEAPAFVGAGHLPRHEAYESSIARSGGVPTRDNLHDLCNGLVWLRWPRLEQRLNRLHAAQIACCGIGATRGPLRDALTLFDESGALLDAPASLVAALRERDWRALFVARRDEWSRANLVLFGHALLAKLVHPRQAITVIAHVRLIGTADSMRWMRPRNLSPRCRCSACPAGGRPMSTAASTTTKPCSAVLQSTCPFLTCPDRSADSPLGAER